MAKPQSLLRFLPLEDRITPAVRMLPDLVPDPANLSGWTVNTVSGGGRELRYSTGMQNLGKGAFELRGTSTIITNPDGTQNQVVVQRVYNDDATFADQTAGTFTYHPTHGHVHYDDFAFGRIRTRPTANWQDGVIVAFGPKTSFCLLDLNHNNPQLPGSPASGVYNTCGSSVQGISVGWKDVYSSGLDGQQINITGLPAGDYWLEVEADPMSRVEETDETNNTTRIPITLTTTQAPTGGLRVYQSSPLGAQSGPVNSITLGFNMPVDAATFTAADVSLTGPTGAIAVSGVTAIDATTLRIDFPSQGLAGTYTANIGPTIANSVDGKLMDQNANGTYGEATADVFTNVYAITSPRVMATSPNGTTTTPVPSVRIQYNKPLVTSTFTLSDIVSFTGPGGADLMGSIAGIVPVTTGTSAIYDINFTTPMAGFGAYTLVLEPNMSDVSGNTVDQNGDLVTTAADRTTVTFSIIPEGVTGPDTFGYTAVSTAYENLSTTTGWTTVHTSDDDGSLPFSLGTNTFNYHGVTYTGANQVYISTNGIITLGASNTAYSNNDLSNLTVNSVVSYPPALAAYWDDLIVGSGSPQVRARLQDVNADGTMDRLLVEWNNVRHYNTTSGDITFQAILQLNTGSTPGDIVYNYADLDAGTLTFNNGASATVGSRAGTSTGTKLVVSQNSGSNALVGSGKAIRIAVPKVASITRMDDSPAVAGDMEYLVTFSTPVTGVDVSDFTLTTTGGIVGATVEHLHTTADPRVYELHVKSGAGSGTLRLNVADNDSIVSTVGAKLGGTGTGNGTFTGGEVYTVVQPPPTVQGYNIGDGTAQRSNVRQLQVVFNTGVVFTGNPADAFQLVGPNGAVTVAVDFSGSAPNQTTARLTFSGMNTESGSLKDGRYTFTVLAANVSTGGVNLDGDGNGTPGGNTTLQLHRLFGDSNGDATVDGGTDFTNFRLGNPTAASSAFDFNNDGTIDGGTDFAEFGLRFGRTI